MADLVYRLVSDWQSWDNAGASVAVADLGGDGSLDLLVLRVDAPAQGPTVGLYAVGKQLRPDGVVEGGWLPWRTIPDWNAEQVDGAGIAVADLGGDGLALVVLQVRSGGSKAANTARVRLGRGLDGDGQVLAGWTDWLDVPDWTSFRNPGAAITVADLDGSGQPDLILFQIDDFHGDHTAPGRPNHGLYRVGRGLAFDGTVTSWEPWQRVDWEAWFNQGAGVAVADLTGQGQSDLVVFQIDNPPGENTGQYRVGWDIGPDGVCRGGWGPWSTFGNWGSWEDQGGGLALARFVPNERPKAVVLHVDNPAGLNEARYAVLDLDLDIDQAATRGVWRLLRYDSEVLPVHAGLLHTGEVLFFAGSGNSIVRRDSPQFVNDTIATSVLWNVADNRFDRVPNLERADGSVVDFFCCGHCALSDGRLLVAGGTDRYDKVITDGEVVDRDPRTFTGIRDAMLFDPVAKTWQAADLMRNGRWYPTLLMLGDGTVLATSGLDAAGATNQDIEHSDAGASWGVARPFGLPLYPHLFLLADGELLYTGGKMDTGGDSVPLVFDPLMPTESRPIAGLDDPGRCNQSASVLLAPAQRQHFMILGGGPEDDDDGGPRGVATQRVAIIDASDPSQPLTFQRSDADQNGERPGDLAHERMHVNAVLLPDRTVLATGGAVTREASAAGAVAPDTFKEVFVAEIFDNTLGTWTDTAPATVARLYHSVALLLPDGRVVTAGGNPQKGSSVDWLPAEDPNEEMRLELFSPPYLFKSTDAKPRPQILDTPTEIRYNDPFTLEVADLGPITACLLRPGLTTHSFNGEQRLVDVPLTQQVVGTTWTGVVDTSSNIAPPGWYMLFILNDSNVPSVGRWMHLLPALLT